MMLISSNSITALRIGLVMSNYVQVRGSKDERGRLTLRCLFSPFRVVLLLAPVCLLVAMTNNKEKKKKVNHLLRLNWICESG